MDFLKVVESIFIFMMMMMKMILIVLSLYNMNYSDWSHLLKLYFINDCVNLGYLVLIYMHKKFYYYDKTI